MSSDLIEIAKMQLERAKNTVAAGQNWRPELIMFRGGIGIGVWIKGDDPMGRATEIIRGQKPDGYVFMNEAWMKSTTNEALEDYQRGDFSKSDDRMEVMIQIAAEDGHQYSNLFTIDRINGVMDPYDKQMRIMAEAKGGKYDPNDFHFKTKMPATW